MCRLVITAIFCSIIGTLSAQNHASNIRTLVSDEQLVIFYDLSEKADVEVYVSFDGGVNFLGPLRNVIGAVGRDVAPENDKVIVWNVVTEYGSVDYPNALIRIIATVEEPPPPPPPPPMVPSYGQTSRGSQGDYKPLRVDLCIGGSFLPLGGLFLVEPKYAVAPKLNIGVKFEYAMLIQDMASDRSSISLQGLMSFFAAVDYHVAEINNIRPFVGAGGGLYMIESAIGSSMGTVNRAETNNFGAMVRAGIDLSHFRAALVYNYAGKDGFDNSANYFGINIGAYLGGGRR